MVAPRVVLDDAADRLHRREPTAREPATGRRTVATPMRHAARAARSSLVLAASPLVVACGDDDAGRAAATVGARAAVDADAADRRPRRRPTTYATGADDVVIEVDVRGRLRAAAR